MDEPRDFLAGAWWLFLSQCQELEDWEQRVHTLLASEHLLCHSQPSTKIKLIEIKI